MNLSWNSLGKERGRDKDAIGEAKDIGIGSFAKAVAEERLREKQWWGT